MTGASRKVLVTGASGFIGRRCLPMLVRAGFEVHAVSSRERAPDGPVQWHRADLLDSAAVARVVERVVPSHLLHAAWIAKPGVFWTSPDNLSWLAGSVALYRHFYQAGGRRAVGVGSCAEYDWTFGDCSESRTPLHPVTVYGQCKAAASFALEAAAGCGSGTSAWARVFFPYGPGEPAERLIPAVIQGLLRGETVDCTHGNQERDFIYVDDVADALVTLLGSAATGAFNVGSGRASPLRDVIAMICARLGRAELIRLGARPAPPGDPARVAADMGRMSGELGWRPSHTLESGIDCAIAAWRGA